MAPRLPFLTRSNLKAGGST